MCLCGGIRVCDHNVRVFCGCGRCFQESGSNFEIADMDFWHGEAYTAFFYFLDKAGGFYYEVLTCETVLLDQMGRFNGAASFEGRAVAYILYTTFSMLSSLNRRCLKLFRNFGIHFVAYIADG